MCWASSVSQPSSSCWSICACELTIKGQEILTADKVAIRASILVQYAVVDPKAALHAVAKYEDRLYSEAQLGGAAVAGGDDAGRHSDEPNAVG